MEELEKKLYEECRESWLKRAFREEWPTIGNHLVSAVISIGAASGFSYIAPNFSDSDAAISAGATVADTVGYWGTFLPQLLYRDRKRLKGKEGNYDFRRITKKAVEHLSIIGFLEGSYIAGRFFGQYLLQKYGMEPAAASAMIQSGGMLLFTFALPPARYAIRQWSEK